MKFKDFNWELRDNWFLETPVGDFTVYREDGMFYVSSGFDVPSSISKKLIWNVYKSSQEARDDVELTLQQVIMSFFETE
jgi:hypothetical protein